MGMPAADPLYILDKLAVIEAFICSQPCNHSECDTRYCTHPLKLVRELKKELEDLSYKKGRYSEG